MSSTASVRPEKIVVGFPTFLLAAILVAFGFLVFFLSSPASEKTLAALPACETDVARYLARSIDVPLDNNAVLNIRIWCAYGKKRSKKVVEGAPTLELQRRALDS